MDRSIFSPSIGTRFLFCARGGGYEMMNAALSLWHVDMAITFDIDVRTAKSSLCAPLKCCVLPLKLSLYLTVEIVLPTPVWPYVEFTIRLSRNLQVATPVVESKGIYNGDA
jgi:hypothetical protein